MRKLRLAVALSAALAWAVPAAAQIPGGSGIQINITPVQSGTNGQCLYVNGAVVGNQACGGAPSGAAGGDLGGTYPNPNVTNLSHTTNASLANSGLANSSMTIAGHSVVLGGTQAIACGDLSNGATGCSTATGTSGATIPLLNGTNTWSGPQTISSTSFSMSGDQSAAAWTTSGVRYKSASGTLTDTTSSGTVAAAYTSLFSAGSTIAASSATTYTDYYGGYFAAPVAGTNVTMTNKWAVGADSIRIVGATLPAGSTASFLKITGTWNDAGTTFLGGLLLNITNSASASNSLLADFQVGGASQLSISRQGVILTSNLFQVPGTGSYKFTNRLNILAPADGQVTLENNAGTGFTSIQLGGTTNSFPEIKRNSAAINFRLADDSADAAVTAAGGTFSGSLINSGITADTGHTDSSVCQDTTTHQFYSGTGTAGICLGTSSARFKRDIRPQTDGLAQIMRLKPKNFFYKDGYGDGGEREQYGFLAEDVVHVIPKMVGLDKNGAPNSVDLLALVPILAHAVQEQQAQINALKGRKRL